MATAADVPGIYDLVVDGNGYLFLDQEDVKAISSFAPTFLQRTNVSDAYEDHDQDWWLTMSQNDWSLGGGQRFRTVKEPDTLRRYFNSTAVWTGVSGRVVLERAAGTSTAASAPLVSAGDYAANVIWYATSTNLYSVTHGGTISDKGAHGLGTSPTCMCVDTDSNVFISGEGGGTVGTRQWNGAAFSTHSTSAFSALAFLNNTMYGLNASVSSLWRLPTAGGAATSLFGWLNADAGFPITFNTPKLLPYGGDLFIAFESSQGLEFWIYDGVAPARVAMLTGSFDLFGLCEFEGAVAIGVQIITTITEQPASIYLYSGGQLAQLWRDEDALVGRLNSLDPFLISFAGQLYWPSRTVSWASPEFSLLRYDPTTGAVSRVGSCPDDAGLHGAATDYFMAVFSTGTTSFRRWPTSTLETSGSLLGSFFDGETSRTKRFKSIQVDYTPGSDGDGGSVDLKYRTAEATSVAVQTGAVSGTEYPIDVSASKLMYEVVLNKGTSSLGPTVNRVYLRAAPVLDAFRKERYILSLPGVDTENDQMLRLRSGEGHYKDGLTMATNLRSAITSATPVSITDIFGTYDAYLIPEECEIRTVRRTGEFVAVITAREV